MRFSYKYVKNQFRKGTEEWQRKIAAAATAAVREAGDVAQREGRANISSSGFSARWQTGWRADMLSPKPGQEPTIDAAVLLHHRIGIASVFESGAKIQGKPLLWLPIEANLPPGRWTPRKYVQRMGPLKSINVPGRKPMLVRAKPLRRDAASKRRLERAGLSTSEKSVPLFVGVDAVSIRKRFRLIDITKRAASRLSEFYSKNLKP